jgi:hypothetical protein
VNDLDQARQAVAEAHGLDEAAAGFLTGGTIQEMDQSAHALMRLLGERHHREPEPEPEQQPDGLRAALSSARKTEEKRRLVELLHGRQAPVRDERGRFATTAGFDGGARQGWPELKTPEEAHNEIVAGMARISRTYRFR